MQFDTFQRGIDIVIIQLTLLAIAVAITLLAHRLGMKDKNSKQK